MRKRLVSRGLVVAVLAGAMSLAAASSHASPARGSASACSSLRNVVAFDGQASVTGGASASGSEDPAGTLTIELVRSAQKVHVHLADKRHEGNYYKFNGHASGGHVVVADVYGDTGGDYQGELNYNQPLGHLPAGSSAGAAVLGIDFSHCAYKFDITFGVQAAYTGDHEADFGHFVTFGATTDASFLPKNLHVHGAAVLKTFPHCEQRLAGNAGCAETYGEWMPELILLDECHTTNTSECSITDTNPALDTPTHFTWSLKPVFKKGKK